MAQRHRLNDRIVASLKTLPGRRTTDYFDSILPGFVVRVTRAGKKCFYVVQREQHKIVWLAVVDPNLTTREWPTLKVKDARELAEAMQKAQTLDAVKAARATAETQRAATFGALAAEYLERHAIGPHGKQKPNKKTWRTDATLIKRQLTPLAEIPVRDLTRREVRALVDTHVDRGARRYANVILCLINKIMNYGIDRDWLDANPCARLALQPMTPRRRVLGDDEVRTLWRWLDAPPVDATPPRVQLWPLLAAWARLRLVTAQRGTEVARMQWKELDLDSPLPMWTLPETKNGLPQRVPLSSLAVEILKGLRASSGDPVWVFAGILGCADRVNLFVGAGVENLQLRDFRRTAATNLAKQGTARFVVARVLNHSDRAMTAIYDVYSYETEKRAALDQWAETLRRIVTTPAPSVARPAARKRKAA